MGRDEDAVTIRRMAGLATPMALRVAVTLGLPDRLLDAAAAADQLAAELDVSPVALDLLLAHLTTLGILERTDTGYRTTGFGAHLCADAGPTHTLANAHGLVLDTVTEVTEQRCVLEFRLARARAV